MIVAVVAVVAERKYVPSVASLYWNIRESNFGFD